MSRPDLKHWMASIGLLTLLVGCSTSVTGTGNGKGSSASAPVSTSGAVSASASLDGGASTSLSSAPSSSSPSSLSPAQSSSPPPPPSSSHSSSTLPSPAPLPVFDELRLDFNTACAPQGGVTTVDAILTWQVSNATGIEVGIDDSNPGDATKYNMTMGSQQITSVQCTGGQKYTFDVWTVGGAAGKQAHRQLSYTSSS